jgi:hypothetical protein
MDWIQLDIRSYLSWGVLGVVGIITFAVSSRLDPATYRK